MIRFADRKCERRNDPRCKGGIAPYTPDVIILILAMLCIRPVQADENLPPLLRGVGIDQRLDEQVPLDLAFRDADGNTIRLGDYFGDKPVILVLAYYKCPRLCTLVLNGLVRTLLDIPFNVGEQFRVVTVSFDPRETPKLAAAKKKSYLERYGRPGAAEGWHFLTGDAEPIKQLTAAVGFRYRYDPKEDQYIHASAIMVLTPGGKLARYFYGVDFSPRDVRLGLVEASEDKIGSRVDQILLFCFHYDPSIGKYGAAVMNFVRLGGVLTILALGTLVIVLVRHEQRKNRKNLITTG
jgi:protein SCO1/2